MDTPPKLFTKPAILVFSTFGSTFFGSILYSTNLKETNHRKFIAPAIIFSILYTYFVNQLTLSLDIPSYYSFIPVHLIGGLLLIGPFWKYQIGSLDSFEKRKIWMPSIALAVPVALFLLYLFYNKQITFNSNRNKLSASEFQRITQTAYARGLKNASFVAQDSFATFFDMDVPLIKSSYFFTTKVEDATSLYNYVDYDEGRFTTLCMRVPLSDKDAFNLTMFNKEYSFIRVDSINSKFESLICADYVRRVNDTATVKGTIALTKIDNTGYQYLTQYTNLNQSDADNLSHSLIKKIFPDSISQAKRKLEAH